MSRTYFDMSPKAEPKASEAPEAKEEIKEGDPDDSRVKALLFNCFLTGFQHGLDSLMFPNEPTDHAALFDRWYREKVRFDDGS